MIKSRIILSIFIAITVVAISPVNAQKYEGIVDKTIAIVGDKAISLFDLESEIQVLKSQGYPVDKDTRCEILEGMLGAKIYVAQAIRDSLYVNEDQVQAELDSRISNALATLGGEAEFEKYFKKPVYKVRAMWRDAIYEQLQTQQMQQEIIKKVPELTPTDVKNFCDTVSEDLPIIPTQYQIRQIVLYPDQESAKLLVKEKLLEIRERIQNGEKFSTLARIYSQDHSNASRGGELGMYSKSVFWSQFSDAAMALKEGQVSQIVETPDGFHLIQMIEKKGDAFNARHILIKPEYTAEDRIKAFDKLDTIRNAIVEDSISFESLAKLYSEDPKTRTNGGLMADQNTGSSFFEKDQLKPSDYNILKNMKEGEVSQPFESTDNEGRSGNVIYKIIKLEKIVPAHTATYTSDYPVLRDYAQNKESSKAVEKFLEEKKKSTFIMIDDMFKGCSFVEEGWIK